MGISSAINNALSGLQTTARRTEITSSNIANALTPGYAAKSVDPNSILLGGKGAGVRLGEVERAYALDLTTARREADGALAYDTARSNALSTIAAAMGEGDDADGLIGRYAAFETALLQLADTPESAARQTDAVDTARAIATKFNNMADSARQAREAAENGIDRAIRTVNSALSEIGALNADIVAFRAASRDASALEDRRETLVDEVAAYLPLNVQYRDDGRAVVQTKQGVKLVDLRVSQIQFTRQPVITPDMVYNGGAGVLSGISVDGTDITPGGPGSQQVAGGQLAGLFSARDVDIPTFQSQLDALAADLIDRFESGGFDPTVAPGAPGLFTDAGAVLDPLDTVGLSRRIAVNDAVLPEAMGDPARMRDGLGATASGPVSDATLPKAMLDAFRAARTTASIPGLGANLGSSETAIALGEIVQNARLGAEDTQASAASVREILSQEEGRVIGVNTDAELSDLLVLEQAYAANAEVIRIANEMLEELRTIAR